MSGKGCCAQMCDDFLGRNDYTDEFEDVEDRHQFIRRVCIILSCQLLFTTGIIAIYIFIEEVQEWSLINWWLAIVAAGILLVIYIMLCYCMFLMRKCPYNWIMLSLFTIAMSIIVGYVVIYYVVEEVMIAFGTTAGICLALTIFAVQTRCDFTVCWGMMIALSIIILVFGIVSFFYREKMFRIGICCLFILIYSFMLVYHIQLCLGGKHKYRYALDDYCLAALSLYIVIISMFLQILQLLGLANDD